MTRFYLEDQTAETAGLTTCDFAAHAMRAEVHARNLNDEEGFNPLHVCVMDAFIPFAALTINEDKLAVMVQAMFYAPVTLPEVYEAIDFLNKKE